MTESDGIKTKSQIRKRLHSSLLERRCSYAKKEHRERKKKKPENMDRLVSETTKN